MQRSAGGDRSEHNEVVTSESVPERAQAAESDCRKSNAHPGGGPGGIVANVPRAGALATAAGSLGRGARTAARDRLALAATLLADLIPIDAHTRALRPIHDVVLSLSQGIQKGRTVLWGVAPKFDGAGTPAVVVGAPGAPAP